MIKLTEAQYDFLNDYTDKLERMIEDFVPEEELGDDEGPSFSRTRERMTQVAELMNQISALRKVQFDNDEW